MQLFYKLDSQREGFLLDDLLNWQRFCEVVIELYYQEVRLVLNNIYMRIYLVHSHVTDQGLPIQHSPQTLNQSEHS